MRTTKIKPKTSKTTEKFITNNKGKREFVILPIKRYNKMLEILEDYGMAKAIKEVQNEKTYSLEEALKMLNVKD